MGIGWIVIIKLLIKTTLKDKVTRWQRIHSFSTDPHVDGTLYEAL